MMTEKTKNSNSTAELVRRLSLAIGVTGYSGDNNVQDVVTAELTPFVDRVERDKMGSVIGVKEGEQKVLGDQPRRKIMLAAHLDEIGGIVTKIDKGFLRFSQIGGLDNRVLMGQEVTVHARRDLPGVIGSIPPHLLPAGTLNNTVDRDEMHIDVGLPPNQVKQLVQIGDLVSFTTVPQEMQNGMLYGKTIDNRASIAAMIGCLQELQKLRHQWDVYAVATADEEWGSYVGATTQTYAIRPDTAIVLDVTFADVDEIEVKMDKGPVLGLGPSNHRVVRQRLVDICKELELKYQSEIMPSGTGTDAAAIEVSREGVPTVLVSVPMRYMHTPIETVLPKDVDRTARLLAQFIAGLDEAFIDELIPV